jgi:ABC-type uncharacterized transport system permease subunit
MILRRLAPVVQPLLSVLGAFVVAGIVVWACGGSPFEALSALLQGSCGSSTGLLRTLSKATPLLLSGLAVAVALRAGLFNIGAEGQLILGALAAAWAGHAFTGLPAWIHIPICLAAGVLVGGLWAAIPGALRAWRGSHEVIVTIMLNYLAIQFAHFLVNGVMKDPGSMAPATAMVEPSARLWAAADGSNFSAGFGLALLAAVGVAVLLRRTALGFEIRAVGLGADAARVAGVNVGRTMVSAMALSGALAGLAGAIEVLGVHRRYLDAFSPGYGFDSIAVALLGGGSPVGVTLSSLLFGGLSAGATYMEAWTHVPRQIAGIVQGVVIFSAGARYLKGRRR